MIHTPWTLGVQNRMSYLFLSQKPYSPLYIKQSKFHYNIFATAWLLTFASWEHSLFTSGWGGGGGGGGKIGWRKTKLPPLKDSH